MYIEDIYKYIVYVCVCVLVVYVDILLETVEYLSLKFRATKARMQISSPKAFPLRLAPSVINNLFIWV